MNKLRPVSIWTALIVSFLAVELIPYFARHLANLTGSALSGWFPEEAFTWLMVHHTCLLALTMLILFVVRGSLSDWGFNFNKWQTSVRIIVIFAVVFSLLEYFYMAGGEYLTDYPQTPYNKFGIQLFQYLLSGVGEEPLFRGLVITLLLTGLSSTRLSPMNQYFIATFVSTLLFMYAHVSVDWVTMSISGFDFGQQTKALQLGVLYAVIFIHTRSLFAPVVLHGLSNGITATIGFYFI